MRSSNIGIYIHIPFCVKKCNYCAFLSSSASNDVIEEYVEALISEIGQRANGGLDDSLCDTIYFGGGTPSLLAEEQLERVLSAVTKLFPISSNCEITLEANPGTLGETDEEVLESFCAYKRLGINRLSMGVQSMNDDRLGFLGRIHSVQDVKRDFALARQAGFANISLDIISAIPGESLDDVLLDIKEICELGPEHISFYTLQIEEGTPFYKWWEEGKLHEIPDELDRQMYHEGCKVIESYGYKQYEISNFAKRGYESLHNSKYWDMSEYIGLGLGASGFIRGERYCNLTNIDEYKEATEEGKLPVLEVVKNTDWDNVSEAVFTGLRREAGIKYGQIRQICEEMKRSRDEASDESLDEACDEGLNEACDEALNDKEWFWEIFAESYDEFASFAKGGFVEMENDGIRLTRKGIDISNKILELFV